MIAQVCSAPGAESGEGPAGRLGSVEQERRMQEIFTANARPLRRFLLRQTHGQVEAAEDLVQETMLRAWRKLAELPDNAVSIRRWLFTVARNLAIDAVRARQSRPAETCGEDVTWIRSTEDNFGGLLDRAALRQALLQLSPEHRTVLVALYYRDASVAEAARGLGIPEGTVRSRSFYALRTVREIIGDDVAF
jgi:RNA polymerase sigma-70 factor (ECF subfamily)